MIRLKPLPPIALTNLQPAFYDVESVTAIEMVSKLYAYVQEMVNDYNSFITEINTEIENFENDTNHNIEEFKSCVQKLMNDYIESIDIKIGLQNKEIADAIDYMKNNIVETATELFEQAIISGTIRANLVNTYNSETEELTIDLDLIEEEGENNE